jgi:GntR family transcriptional regulator
VIVLRAIDDLEMDKLPAEDAALFHTTAGAPCMRIERLMHDHAGQPIEWRVSYVPPERFHYTVEIR